MSSTILGIKLMGAFLVGSAIVAIAVKGLGILSQVPPPIKEDKNKYYKENCYIVESTSKFSDQLLVCNNGNYFLYRSGDNKPFRKVKNLSLKSKDNISVELEKNDSEQIITDYSFARQEPNSANNICSISKETNGSDKEKMTLSCKGFSHKLSLITFSK